jgi:hypothetical protein
MISGTKSVQKRRIRTLSGTNKFQDALKGQPASLALFLQKMGEFDKLFCDLMAGGADFNIRLELRGNKGDLIHCRVSTDSTDRPAGAQKEETNPVV